jgi:hypothetical protein
VLHQTSVSNKIIEPKSVLVNKKKSPAKSLESIENEDARFQMISEAAYYRALGRGFDGGDPLQDWLISEVKVDGMPLDHS